MPGSLANKPDRSPTPPSISMAKPMRLLFLAIFAATVGCSAQPAAQLPDADTQLKSATGTITIEVAVKGESDDKIQRFTVEDVANGETVEDVMRRADDADITITGSGTTAFVHQIGDLATGSSTGWTYTVNNERAEKGIGATMLTPPATVKWSFGEYDD